MRVEPAGLDIRRQLAHRLGERRENLPHLARIEPPFPGHAAHLSGLVDGETSTAPAKYRVYGALKQRQLIALLRRGAKPGGVERLRRSLVETELAAGTVEAQPQHVGIGAGAGHAL